MASCPVISDFNINDLILDSILQSQGTDPELFMTMKISKFIEEVGTSCNIPSFTYADWITFIDINPNTNTSILIDLLNFTYNQTSGTSIAPLTLVLPTMIPKLTDINAKLKINTTGTFNFKELLKILFDPTPPTTILLPNNFNDYLLFLFIYIINSITYAAAHKLFMLSSGQSEYIKTNIDTQTTNTPPGIILGTTTTVTPTTNKTVTIAEITPGGPTITTVTTISYNSIPFSSSNDIQKFLEWISIKSIRLIYTEPGQSTPPTNSQLVSRMAIAKDSTDYYTNVVKTISQQGSVMFLYLDSFLTPSGSSNMYLQNLSKIFTDEGTATHLYNSFGYSGSYTHTISTARDLLEHMTPTVQCNNTVGSFVANTKCYICGLCIVNKAECEHILPVSMACKHFCLYILTAEHRKRLTSQQLQTLKQNVQLEYKWAHRCCNQLKSNDINFIILDKTTTPPKYRFSTQACNDMWSRLKNAVSGPNTKTSGNEICSDFYNFSCASDSNGSTGKKKSDFFSDDNNKNKWCSELRDRLDGLILFLNASSLICNPNCCNPTTGSNQVNNIYLYRLLQYQKSILMRKLAWNNLFGGSPVEKTESFVKKFVSNLLSDYSKKVSESLYGSMEEYNKPVVTKTQDFDIMFLKYSICNCLLIYLSFAYLGSKNLPYSMTDVRKSYSIDFLFVTLTINTSISTSPSATSVLYYFIQSCQSKNSFVTDFLNATLKQNVSNNDFSLSSVTPSEKFVKNEKLNINEFIQLCDYFMNQPIQVSGFQEIIDTNKLLNNELKTNTLQGSSNINISGINKTIYEITKKRNGNYYVARLFVYLYQIMQGVVPFLLAKFVETPGQKQNILSMNDFLSKVGNLYNIDGTLKNNGIENHKILFGIPYEAKKSKSSSSSSADTSQKVDWNKVYDTIIDKDADDSSKPTSSLIFESFLTTLFDTIPNIDDFNNIIINSGTELMHGGKTHKNKHIHKIENNNQVMVGGVKQFMDYAYDDPDMLDVISNRCYFDNLDRVNSIEIVEYYNILDNFKNICDDAKYRELCTFIFERMMKEISILEREKKLESNFLKKGISVSIQLKQYMNDNISNVSIFNFLKKISQEVTLLKPYVIILEDIKNNNINSSTNQTILRFFEELFQKLDIQLDPSLIKNPYTTIYEYIKREIIKDDGVLLDEIQLYTDFSVLLSQLLKPKTDVEKNILKYVNTVQSYCHQESILDKRQQEKCNQITSSLVSDLDQMFNDKSGDLIREGYINIDIFLAQLDSYLTKKMNTMNLEELTALQNYFIDLDTKYYFYKRESVKPKYFGNYVEQGKYGKGGATKKRNKTNKRLKKHKKKRSYKHKKNHSKRKRRTIKSRL